MKKEEGTVVNKEAGVIDSLIDRYLSDPESLSLEDQGEVYRHLLDRVSQAGAGTQEIELLKESLVAVEEALKKAGQGDPGYLKTSGGTYRKRGAEMKTVPIDQLILDPGFQDLFQNMGGEDFEQLKESIREIGIIAPIVVDPELRVICGHQRLRAAREIGLETIPVVVRWVGDEEILAVIAIEENIRRRQLQPSEMARAIKKLVELKGKIHKTQEVAREIGLSKSQIKRYRGLSDLIPEISVLLDGGKLTQAAAIQIAQMDDVVQHLFYETLGDRIAQAVSEQKAIEFRNAHADLLNQVQNLSETMQKLEQRKEELETRLKEMRERLDQAEFKVGDEMKAKRVFEEELEKTRAEMYQKVQEKQALIDKLHKNIEPMVVPPPDYQTLKDENEKLKETLKQTARKSKPPADALAAELHTMVTGRLLTIDPQAFKGDLSPKTRENLKNLIQPIETWVGQLKQVIQGPGKAEKKRSQKFMKEDPVPVLPDEDRDILVKRLAACGLPTREIVRLTGTSGRTVARILQRYGIRRKKPEPLSSTGRRHSNRLPEILTVYYALEEVTLSSLERTAREHGLTLKKLCDLIREHVSPTRWAIRNCLGCGQSALTSSTGDRYCGSCKKRVRKDQTAIADNFYE